MDVTTKPLIPWLNQLFQADFDDPLELATDQERKASIIRALFVGFGIVMVISVGWYMLTLEMNWQEPFGTLNVWTTGGIMLGTFALMAGIYYLNQYGYTTLACFTFVHVGNLIVLGAYFAFDLLHAVETHSPVGASGFVSLPLLLSGMLIGAHSTLAIGVMDTLIVISFAAISKDDQVRFVVSSTINDWWLLTFAGWLFAFTLENSLKRLRAARQNLEKLVAVRTQQVEEKNRQLQQEVEERKRAEEAAEAANRAKSAFLANMSHELRTPLNAILGFTQLMEHDTSVTPTLRDNVNIINHSGKHLLELINDVLEMSKIEAGHSTLNPIDCDLHQLLVNIEGMFRVRAREKGLNLHLERPADLPRYIHADERKLRQVLMNLLSNAVKFTYAGAVVLRITHREIDPNAIWLHIEVEDTGAGIAESEKDHVFEAFVQTRSGLSQEGTGLGLPISRHIVQMMGGDLTFTSEIGQGTVFQFEVRVDLAEPPVIEASDPRRVVALAAGQPTYRILIVEDNLENRLLLRKLLEPLGFEIQEAVNGQAGVDLYRKWQPHLILLDMRMPVMDGYEAAQQIRASGGTVTIIALTASAFEEHRQEILAAGCDDFMGKPFRQADLFQKIAAYLGVQFIYEDGTAAATENLLTRESLAALSPEWRQTMREVAMSANFKRALDLITPIRSQHPEIALPLADLINNFRFDVIMQLTE